MWEMIKWIKKHGSGINKPTWEKDDTSLISLIRDGFGLFVRISMQTICGHSADGKIFWRKIFHPSNNMPYHDTAYIDLSYWKRPRFSVIGHIGQITAYRLGVMWKVERWHDCEKSYFRSDMPSIQVKIGFIEYVFYVIDALTLRCVIVFKVVVFLYVHLAATRDRDIFVPIYWYSVQMSVSAPFVDVCKTLFRTIAVCIYGDCGVIICIILLLGFENTIRYTIGVFEICLLYTSPSPRD